MGRQRYGGRMVRPPRTGVTAAARQAPWRTWAFTQEDEDTRMAKRPAGAPSGVNKVMEMIKEHHVEGAPGVVEPHQGLASIIRRRELVLAPGEG